MRIKRLLLEKLVSRMQEDMADAVETEIPNAIPPCSVKVIRQDSETGQTARGERARVSGVDIIIQETAGQLT